MKKAAPRAASSSGREARAAGQAKLLSAKSQLASEFR